MSNVNCKIEKGRLTLGPPHNADGVLRGNVGSGQADCPGGKHDVAQGAKVALRGQFARTTGVGLKAQKKKGFHVNGQSTQNRLNC